MPAGSGAAVLPAAPRMARFEPPGWAENGVLSFAVAGGWNAFGCGLGSLDFRLATAGGQEE